MARRLFGYTFILLTLVNYRFACITHFVNICASVLEVVLLSRGKVAEGLDIAEGDLS